MRDEVAVTGAEGFIGSHLVETLVRRGYRVRAMVLYNMHSSRGWLDELPADVLDQVDVVFGDVRDPASVRQVVEGVAVVYHLAALGSVPYSYRAPRSFVDTNMIGTLHVLEAVRACRNPRLVHTSTSETYGTARSVPISEAHPLQAQSPYAAVQGRRRQARRVLLPELRHARGDAPAVQHLRPAPVGPRRHPGHHHPARRRFPAAASWARWTRPAISPTSATPPRRSSDLGEAPASAVVGELFNAGTGTDVSIGQLAADIAAADGRGCRHQRGPPRLRPKDSEVMRLAATRPGCATAPGGSRATPVSRDSSRPSNGSSGRATWPATTRTSTTSEQRRQHARGHSRRGQGHQAAALHDETPQAPRPDRRGALDHGNPAEPARLVRLQPGHPGHRPPRRADPVLRRRRQPVGRAGRLRDAGGDAAGDHGPGAAAARPAAGGLPRHERRRAHRSRLRRPDAAARRGRAPRSRWPPSSARSGSTTGC